MKVDGRIVAQEQELKAATQPELWPWSIVGHAMQWVSDEPFPGVVELHVVAAGRLSRVQVQAAVLGLSIHAEFPLELQLPVWPVGPIDQDFVRVLLPWGLATIGGETELVVEVRELRTPRVPRAAHQPTSFEVEQAKRALMAFVDPFSLSVNPEDLHLMAFLAIKHGLGNLTPEEIWEDARAIIAEELEGRRGWYT